MVVNLLKPNNKKKKVALLATGDEITNGDILNTNSQNIAQRLFEHNIDVGLHIITSDDQQEIRDNIVYLLKHHDGLIITGGLGPTSDDRTRFALSAALKKPLIFDTLSWSRIVSRIARATSKTPPESNRQQALFPKDAEILENDNGTAAGCHLYLQGKSIFMLPGPPNECLPMFDQFVLSRLINAKFQKAIHHKKWLLFGVNEGKISGELDQLVDGFDVTTGFRIAYPYIEFKLHAEDVTQFNNAIETLTPRIEKHLICDGEKPISELLKQHVEHMTETLDIHDFATGGHLEVKLRNPKTASHLIFHKEVESNDHLHVTIKGLNEYWQNNFEAKETKLKLTFSQNGKLEEIEQSLPCYSPKVIHYAVEMICHEIFKRI